MLESFIEALDYFDNEGNNKLEQQLRIALKELDKDLVAAGYAAPKNVIEALNNLNEALEDVEEFLASNDLTDEEILDSELEPSTEDEEAEAELLDDEKNDDTSEDAD